MQKGMADCTCAVPEDGVAIGLDQVAQYWNDTPLGIASAFSVMNLDTWNSLPEDIQNVITQVSHEFPTKHAQVRAKLLADTLVDVSGTVTFIHWTEEDSQKLKPIAEGIWEDWAAARESEGLAGKEVLNYFRDAVLRLEGR